MNTRECLNSTTQTCDVCVGGEGETVETTGSPTETLGDDNSTKVLGDDKQQNSFFERASEAGKELLYFAGMTLLAPLFTTGCSSSSNTDTNYNRSRADGGAGDAGGPDSHESREPRHFGGNIIGGVDWIDATQLAGPEAESARASGQIGFNRPDGRYECSANIISSDLIMTNHHCIPDAASATDVRFYPTTESDVSAGQRDEDSFDCSSLVATNCSHDVSILKCQPHHETGLLPGDSYRTAMLEIGSEFSENEQIYLLHTNCDYRDSDCQKVKLLSRGRVVSYGHDCITFPEDLPCQNCRSDAPQAHHTCDSLGGSSGGGIFDASSHRLMGLNWGSSGGVENQTGGYNFATSIAHMVATDANMASILMPLAPCEDRDGDGYGRMASQHCRHPEADCNDTEPGIHPFTAEICDTIDNDCNGRTDEALRPCGSDVGECRQGKESCVGGAWQQECVGEIRPTQEICDAKDNDCDGNIDNDLRRECGSSVGECRKGAQMCFFGEWSECQGEVKPQPEFCDGRDNDCDGVADDGVDPMREAVEKCPDLGVCANGGAVNACVNGAWMCRFPENYVEEECPVARFECGFGDVNDPLCNDGLDNDCDGVIDEHSQYGQCLSHPDFWKVTSGIECFVSTQGECGRHGGTYKCVQLAEGCGVNIDCVGAQFPAHETCDGRDMGCNGIADDRNDYDRDGFGDCPGKMDCDETNANVRPGATEVCDGKDNNCNGAIDEGNLCDDGNPATQDSCGGAAGCQHNRFAWVDNTSGTGLMWQDPQYEGGLGWIDATNYCSGLVLGGYSDWRLPSLLELRSLIRGCAATQPGGSCGANPSTGCSGCSPNNGPGQNGYYWDSALRGTYQANTTHLHWSSEVAYPSGGAFMIKSVGFERGGVGVVPHLLQSYTRCVR